MIDAHRMIDAPLDKGTVRIGNASFERESIDQDRPVLLSVLLSVQSEGANDLDDAVRVSVSVLRARKIALEIAGRSLAADDLSSNSAPSRRTALRYLESRCRRGAS